MINILSDLDKTMEPILCSEPFDSDNFVYQVKWDGVRMLAVIENGAIQLINKHMNHRTKQYPELQELGRALKLTNAVLDGEVVVLKGGKPSFPSVMRRDQSSKTEQIKYIQDLLPVAYMVFDLLYLNGKDLCHHSLEERQAALESIWLPQPYLHLVENFPGGTALFAAIEKMGMEGIVAKKKGSRYSPGKSHKDWLKIKCRRSLICLVGGYTLRESMINSLMLGVYQDGKLNYVGKAATGLTASQLELLSQHLPVLRIMQSPFENLIVRNKDYYYVKPQIAIQVEYLEWTEDLHLRSPVIKAFVDISVAQCNQL